MSKPKQTLSREQHLAYHQAGLSIGQVLTSYEAGNLMQGGTLQQVITEKHADGALHITMVVVKRITPQT